MSRSDYQREYYMARKLPSDYAAETFEERSRAKRADEDRIAKGFITITNEPQIMDANSFTFAGVIGAFLSQGKVKRYSWSAQ